MERVVFIVHGRVYENGKIESHHELIKNVQYVLKNKNDKNDKYKIDPDSFLVKFVDDEGDYCSITSEDEYAEAVRIAKDTLNLFVFDKNYFDNIHLKRKFALKNSKSVSIVKNGHIFSVKRGQKKACAVCEGNCPSFLSTNLYCRLCRLSLHKRCLDKITSTCTFANTTTQVSETKYFTTVEFFSDASSGRSHNKTGEPKLSDFELVKVIGRGSYSKVVLVKETLTENYYAVKAVKKLSVSFEDMKWVFHEKKILKMTQHSPFFVKLRATFQDPLRLYFLLEFVAGGDLMYLLQKKHALKEPHAQFYLAEIICALDFLHKINVLYRDLKLDNILVADDGHIKLTDFGLCKLVSSSKTLTTMSDNDETWTFCGTPNCIAPEVILERPYGISVDWWCLGIVMYEILIGKSPFEDLFESYMDDYCRVDGGYDAGNRLTDGLFQMIVEKDVRMPRTISVKASKLIKSLLTKNPAERIGCPPHSSVADIQASPFFREVDWERADKKLLPPPFVPSDTYRLTKTTTTNTTTNTKKYDYMTALYENFDRTILMQQLEMSDDEPDGPVDQDFFLGF